ncbi:SDR family NAD(P)-dependent oxidoreductase [Sphingobium yanoikuyae]|uniref:SDR family NAD(P)-dependent oxidoreductase n=2 Tax=Sphingobium TaxID=165695 RepID=UPI0022DDC831|nr:SDR family NAD(P)-dependent oxidoreductase [Sphingobium yanoikuyae]WBQ19011.1 SDR family NAD(P)-dependent oxidoreductase [Sphingobium yanoikuyae]
MARVFITGSSTGLGLAAAQSLLAAGHDVVLHARNVERTAALAAQVPQALAIVTGDLSLLSETRDLADAVNAIGRMDAVIHNAGLYGASGRGRTAEGHSVMTAVNLLAPYVLTACIERPGRLVYMSSRLHRGGTSAPVDIATGQATQSWLAASDDEAAQTSGGYWHAMRREEPAFPAASADYGDRLLTALQAITGASIGIGS